MNADAVLQPEKIPSRSRRGELGFDLSHAESAEGKTPPVSPVLCGEQEQGRHLGLEDWRIGGLEDWGIGRHSLGHKEQEK